MLIAGRWLRTSSHVVRASLPSRPIARAVGVLALVAGVACQDVTPTSPPTGLTPNKPARVLTGASGTDIFATAAPGDIQDVGKALALNNVGQVTGTWLPKQTAGSDARVFRWSVPTGAVLVSGCCGGDQVGLDINDAGVITGRSFASGSIDATRAFRATGNTIVNLPTFANASNVDASALGLAINNAGQIAGWAEQGNGYPRHAVMWTASDALVDLGTLGGTNSQAVDINASGVVIGSSQTTGDAATHYFRWSSGTGMQDLSVLVDPNITSVVAINDAGQITGTFINGSGQSHAFLYTPGSGLRDLGTLGGTTSTPTGLNNKGQVVGSSGVSNAATHAFLWTQTDGMEDITAITGVPEVKGLNDNLQTVTGTQGYGPGNYPMPKLVQLTVTPSGNQPPVASFTANCVGQSSPNQCAFDASASTDDKGIASYKWDWGNGRTETKTGATTRNTWSAPGVYTVTLTVTDAGGLTSTASKQLTIGTPPNQSPAATISAPISGRQFQQGMAVVFSGTGADPEDGQLSGASLVWSSNIDGVLGTGNSFTRNNLSVGTHTITLTVTDSKGATGTATTTVVIYVYDPAPTPSFTWTCTGQTSPHQCAFDASASTDDKGIVSYKWDWGNGRTETKTGPTTRNTWASAGTYTVTLSVSDGNSTVGKSQQVTVP
jgi:probable HAF family extracellular repeat protein